MAVVNEYGSDANNILGNLVMEDNEVRKLTQKIKKETHPLRFLSQMKKALDKVVELNGIDTNLVSDNARKEAEEAFSRIEQRIQEESKLLNSSGKWAAWQIKQYTDRKENGAGFTSNSDGDKGKLLQGEPGYLDCKLDSGASGKIYVDGDSVRARQSDNRHLSTNQVNSLAVKGALAKYDVGGEVTIAGFDQEKFTRGRGIVFNSDYYDQQRDLMMQASKAGLVVNEKQLSHLKPEDYKQCKEDCKKMMANEAKKHALPEPDGAVKKVTKKEEKKEEDKEKLSITPTLNK